MSDFQQDLTKKERKELKRQERDESQALAQSKRNKMRIFTWLTVGIVIGVSVWGLIILASRQTPSSDGTLAVPIGASDWKAGNPNAKTTLVEYSDFQCPACAFFAPIVKKIVDDNPDKIVLVYRNYPLQQHANALITAYAAQAAGLQGKFWEMHDKIFENQNAWSNLNPDSARTAMMTYASQLKLDIGKFTKDIDSAEVKTKIENDYKSGSDSNINATPTFFLNGKKMAPPNSYDDFRNQILQAISTS